MVASASFDLDVVVIGGGVVGLAVARALAIAGREVTLLEREGALGVHTSSRNSEVIHAGIYYPTGSRKAKLCVEGRKRLYEYCERMRVPFRRLGKLIVAVHESEIATLDGYLAQARANGVDDLEWVDAATAARLEPAVRCVRALHSPSTGIVDSHELMLAYRAEAEAHGAQILLGSGVSKGVIADDGFVLEVGGVEPMSIRVRSVVNAAGLWAPAVAGSFEGFPARFVPSAYFAKGHYFTLQGRSPFSRLIYPVAQPGGLGVHVTLDMAGRARFGPDVSWIPGVDYTFDEGRAHAFEEAVRTYVPGLASGTLEPGYVGIRPKITGPGQPAGDFIIQGWRDHGVPGLLHLFGIESPGLTASLALADEVVRAL